MEIDKEIYKGFEIKVYYNTETRCFSSSSKLGNSNNKYQSELKNFCHGYKTPSEAIEDVKNKIDKFLNQSISSYTDLAEVITNSLTWTGYESCYLDEQVLKTILERFNATAE